MSAHTHTDLCQLAERMAHHMRVGLAVDMARKQGAVEVLIRDLDATAEILAHADLAHACDKGGDELDGPVTLTDEPTGDAMRCTPQEDEPTHYTTWGWHFASQCGAWPECPQSEAKETR